MEGQGFKGRRLTVQDFGFQGFGFRVSRGFTARQSILTELHAGLLDGARVRGVLIRSWVYIGITEDTRDWNIMTYLRHCCGA